MLEWPLIVLGEAFLVAEVFDGCEDLLDGGEEGLVDRFGEPLGPFFDVFGVGGSGDGGSDVGVGAGELEGELGDVYSIVLAEFCGGSGGGFDFLWFLEPVGEGGIGEEAGGEGAGIDRSEPFSGEAGEELVGKGGVLEGVLIVGEDAVDVVFYLIEDLVEAGHGVAGESDGADFSFGFCFENGGDGFLPNLGEFDELDIVEEEEVEVVGAEAVEGGVDGFLDAGGGEIEVLMGVASEF